MSEKINMDELKAMIASEIKNDGFHEVLDNTTIEVIANNILQKQKMENAKSAIPDIIPEQTESSTAPSADTSTTSGEQDLPSSKYYSPSTNLDDFGTGVTNSPTQIDHGTTGNIPAYTPELPSFMDKIEPGKVIIFDTNELSHGGENLSHVPLRTFENPDIKKSMNDMWTKEGKRKVDVYIAKFEKIGDIEFNYTNGTSQFIEKRFNPDFEAQASYKENPYSTPSVPQAVDNSNIMAQISTAVDLEAVVTKVIMDLIQKGMMSNSAGPISMPSNHIEESTPGYAAYKMFKGNGDIQELNAIANNFDINMSKLVDDGGLYIKTDIPEELKEHIGSGNREFLKNENQEVEEWSFDGMNYYLPKNRISKNKGYVLKKN